MKPKHVITILVAVLLAIVPASLKASHFAGGEITYRCVGTDSFLLTIALYRDCDGVIHPTTATLNISSPGCTTIQMTLTKDGPSQEITPLCPGWTSPCSQGGQSQMPVGIERQLYSGLLVFDSLQNSACETWTISYRLCCRGLNLTNISNGGSQTGFLGATLFRGTAGGNGSPLDPCPRNSSPQFANVPVPVLCVGQEFVYNHGVTDPDGDSLSFSLVPCRSSESVFLPYISPLSGTQPLNTSAPITVNSQTGTLRITPSIEQIGVVCFLVEEFRNGVKIGEVYRDMTFIVVNCSVMVPAASGMSQDPGNWSSHFDTVVCPNQPITFNIYTHIPDPNFAKPLCMTWNSGITNATFSVTDGPNPTGCFSLYPSGSFSWTPTQADIGFHYFTVTVQDDGCPLAQNIWSYSIEVREPDVTLPDTLVSCNGRPVVLHTGNTSATAQLNQFTWIPQTGVADPHELFTSINPMVGTTYTLLGSNPHCSASATMHVEVATVDTSVQQAGHVLTAQEPGAQYKWIDCDHGFAHIPGATAQDFQPTVSGNYAVIVTKNGCTDTSDCHYVLLTGIEDAGHGPGIRLYPNPAKGTLYVEIDASRAGNYRLQLYNVAGQMVHGETIAVAEGTTTLQLETTHLAAGLYQAVVEGEDGRRVQKVVVME